MSLLDNASLILTPNAYKVSKLYSIVPTNGNGDMTFTRNTTDTRFNSDNLIENLAINVPTINYPNLGGCASILLEPQRTNLTKNSQVFNTAFWQKDLTTAVDNNTTSPSGATNASLLTEVAGTGSHHIHEAVGAFVPTISNSYTMSCFVKLPTTGQGRFVQLPFFIAGFGVNAFVNFDLLNGVVGNVGSSITNSSIIPLANGWFRISATASATAIGLSGFQLSLITSATSVRTESYTVTAGNEKNVFIWGTQLEQGAGTSAAYPTSYIPTTTTALTRNADVLSRNNVYTNNLITSAGGTWFIDLENNISYTRDIASNGIFIADNTSVTNGLRIRVVSTGRLIIEKVISGTNTLIYTTLVNKVKIAIKWNGSTADVFVNGTKVISATSFTPTVMELINLLGAGVSKYIKSMMLFPTPLTDTESANLTTL